MSDFEDEDFFRQQLGDVKPLKKSDKALLKKPQTSRDEDALKKVRANAVEHTEISTPTENNNFVSDDYVEMVKPTDVLSFKRPGIQDGVFRKFRLGKYVIDGRLDLHRKTVEQARREVFSFLLEGMQYDSRCLLILHGKGDRNIERPAVIKSYCAKWLKESGDVMAYHSAQQQHGGTGALYVLLRKSDGLKEKNREQYGRRA